MTYMDYKSFCPPFHIHYKFFIGIDGHERYVSGVILGIKITKTFAGYFIYQSCVKTIPKKFNVYDDSSLKIHVNLIYMRPRTIHVFL